MPDLHEFEARLIRLEQKNRRLTVMLIFVIAISAVLFYLAKKEISTDSEIRAHQFVLLNDDNKEIGRWDSDEDKSASFKMGSEENTKGFHVFKNSGSPFLRLRHDSGSQITMTSGEAGSVFSVANGGIEGKARSLAMINSSAMSSRISLTSSQGDKLELSAGSGRPITSYLPDGKQDWWVTRGSFNFNGLKLRLNNSAGEPILILPENPQ